ncbi:putative polygalacturonase [Lupinus albus]|uniref:Putative polygalacturonase n=1 Tax=Lupinus albus TaxID=3870 RepID=A0A6A4PSC3_LUPAL|nr:putative polygalacturonase [Lupinus albus]
MFYPKIEILLDHGTKLNYLITYMQALSIHKCPNLKLVRLTSKNSPRNHLSINGCNGSYISGLKIRAPGDSPNTDGVDISESSHIVIKHSSIHTGDDCIAINSGSSFINITGVICGPGHGISIGSLGKNGAYATVEEVHVRNCTFTETQNGVRIKTWKGGSGYARKITFEDIRLQSVRNPIIITQQYIDLRSYGSNSTIDQKKLYGSSSAVALSDITYKNVWGTSDSEDAIQLSCDKNVGCTNIVLERIYITHSNGWKTYAWCQNAHGNFSSSMPNVPCLS